jgi:hypothetical protein
MNKLKLNYWIDVGLATTFVAVFITGIIKWPGQIRLFGISHRNLPMINITLIHDWSGLIMGILVFIHLVLHWNWIVCVTKKIFKGDNKICKE